MKSHLEANLQISFNRALVRYERLLRILLSVYQSKDIIITEDLADKFSVDALTIKRDLSFLRNKGFRIHSAKGEGICLLTAIHPDKIQEELHDIQMLKNFAVDFTSLINRSKDKKIRKHIYA